MQQQYPIPV